MSIKQNSIFFWNSLAFSMIQWMLVIWPLVPLPFLNPAWASGCLLFMYSWSLAWRILSNYFASMWDECNCVVVGTFFGTWDGMKTELFQSCGHCCIFQICWHVECSTFTASSFRIWNNSIGIPSPPLALFIVMLPMAHMTSHSRISVLVEWSHHCGCLGHEDLFCIVLLCIHAISS